MSYLIRNNRRLMNINVNHATKLYFSNSFFDTILNSEYVDKFTNVQLDKMVNAYTEHCDVLIKDAEKKLHRNKNISKITVQTSLNMSMWTANVCYELKKT